MSKKYPLKGKEVHFQNKGVLGLQKIDLDVSKLVLEVYGTTLSLSDRERNVVVHLSEILEVFVVDKPKGDEPVGARDGLHADDYDFSTYDIEDLT